jgi:hypothetical protein
VNLPRRLVALLLLLPPTLGADHQDIVKTLCSPGFGDEQGSPAFTIFFLFCDKDAYFGLFYILAYDGESIGRERLPITFFWYCRAWQPVHRGTDIFTTCTTGANMA